MKKFLSCILAVMMLAVIAVPFGANATYLTVWPGDANGDGKRDIIDVVTIRAYIVGTQKFEDDAIFFDIADASGDNTVDIIDVVLVRKAIVTGDTGTETVTVRYDGYNLYLGGNAIVDDYEVTENMPTGVSFADGVLTLDNATINIADAAFGIWCDEDLEIILKGENTIVVLEAESIEDMTNSAICVSGSLKISGNGSLTANGSFFGIVAGVNLDICEESIVDVSAYSTAIMCTKELTVNNANVIAKSELMGILASNSINIINSKFNVESGFVGMLSENEINLTNSDVNVNVNSESENGIGIAAMSKITIDGISGTVLAPSAAVTCENYDAENKPVIELKNVTMNDAFKVSEYIATEEGENLYGVALALGEVTEDAEGIYGAATNIVFTATAD